MSEHYEATKLFAEAIKAELVRQTAGSHLWVCHSDEVDSFNVDGDIDLLALADVVIKLALDEGFAS